MKPRLLRRMPIWADDWLSSARVLEMTAEQEGGLIRLCLLQWREGSLPDDDAILLRLARVAGPIADHRILLEAFALCTDGRRRNDKVARVRASEEAYLDGQSKAGSKGNQVRWGSRPDRDPIANASPPDSGLRNSSLPSVEKRARGKPRLPLADEVCGTPLARADFIEAMETWESSHGRYKPAGLRAQITRLGAWGPDRAIAAIRYSLAQGFQGIYEDKNGHSSNNANGDDDNVRQQIEQLARVSQRMTPNKRTLIP